MLTGITLFRLVTASLLPVLVTVGFYRAEKKTGFGKISDVWKQIIIGVSFGAGVRKFMMDNKKASWFYGLAVGVTSEVLHMLLVFLTNADDIQRAFSVVKICAVPMIAANGLSVMLSILAITFLAKRSGHHEADSGQKENIAQNFQRWLLVCVVLAFGITILSSVSDFSFVKAYFFVHCSPRSSGITCKTQLPHDGRVESNRKPVTVLKAVTGFFRVFKLLVKLSRLALSICVHFSTLF